MWVELLCFRTGTGGVYCEHANRSPDSIKGAVFLGVLGPSQERICFKKIVTYNADFIFVKHVGLIVNISAI